MEGGCSPAVHWLFPSRGTVLPSPDASDGALSRHAGELLASRRQGSVGAKLFEGDHRPVELFPGSYLLSGFGLNMACLTAAPGRPEGLAETFIHLGRLEEPLYGLRRIPSG